MCTVTFVSDSDRFILTMNRDDAAVRVEAPPREARTNDIAYLSPIDVRSGGTWIGVNAQGIGACLLNRYDPRAAAAVKPRRDRACGDGRARGQRGGR